MPLFEYKAQDEKRKIIEDTIQAANREDAAAALRGMRLSILTIKNLDSGFGATRGKISVSEKAIFCRFMATMLRSGLSIPESIEIIRAETTNTKMRKVLADLAYQTQKGKTLASVLSQYKESFDPIFITMVKVGEESGTLEKSFQYLTTQLTASHELSQKIKGSLMYPAVIVVAMFGNGLIMMFFVLPKISSVFLKLDVPLPLPTKIILTVGNFIGQNTLISIIGIAIGALIVGLTVYLRPTRQFLLNMIRRFPVVKKISNQIDIARFARTLSTLLRSGVPITTSLDVSSEGLSDSMLRSQAKKFSEGVSKGEQLSVVMARSSKLFPPIMIQTIKAGEKTGSLEEILQEMATFYESEVEYSLKRATALLEPVLMLIIGVAVGGMVIIMIAPIYGIIGGLQQQIKQ
jgi:type II secretory pathway component PulF